MNAFSLEFQTNTMAIFIVPGFLSKVRMITATLKPFCHFKHNKKQSFTLSGLMHFYLFGFFLLFYVCVFVCVCEGERKMGRWGFQPCLIKVMITKMSREGSTQPFIFGVGVSGRITKMPSKSAFHRPMCKEIDLHDIYYTFKFSADLQRLKTIGCRLACMLRPFKI